MSSDRRKHLAVSQNLFESLELGIWILFVICYLVLEISYSQGLNYNLGIQFGSFNVFVGHILIHSSKFLNPIPGNSGIDKFGWINHIRAK
jgi:hypothetical protein